jgi:hypothetical protein
MLYNLRAKSTNNNGASITYTWRNVECENDEVARTTAIAWAQDTDAEFKSNELPYQTKMIEVSFPSDKELDDESYERCREKAEFELFCGGYDE